jgi:glycosyltransferase involved in cell wall biosynthesis
VTVAVVVPARDEAALIGRCLQSIGNQRVIVVADRCHDDTAAIARALGAEVIEIDEANVGLARAIGCDAALRDPDVDWLACTDADSVVPANWIEQQLELASFGADAVVATVRPDFADLSPLQTRAWLSTHQRGAANGHVHGANLGLRASAYLAVGGFAPVSEHEDNDLVARLAAAGFTVTPTAAIEVITSGRTFGRTPGGYARYLRDDLVSSAELIA